MADEANREQPMFGICKNQVKVYVQFKDQSQIKISHNLLILEEIS